MHINTFFTYKVGENVKKFNNEITCETPKRKVTIIREKELEGVNLLPSLLGSSLVSHFCDLVV